MSSAASSHLVEMTARPGPELPDHEDLAVGREGLAGDPRPGVALQKSVQDRVGRDAVAELVGVAGGYGVVPGIGREQPVAVDRHRWDTNFSSRCRGCPPPICAWSRRRHGHPRPSPPPHPVPCTAGWPKPKPVRMDRVRGIRRMAADRRTAADPARWEWSRARAPRRRAPPERPQTARKSRPPPEPRPSSDHCSPGCRRSRPVSPTSPHRTPRATGSGILAPADRGAPAGSAYGPVGSPSGEGAPRGSRCPGTPRTTVASTEARKLPGHPVRRDAHPTPIRRRASGRSPRRRIRIDRRWRCAATQQPIRDS
jgi:hypothetical protein